MQNFEKLEVYNEAKMLALDIYRITKNFPKEELFGITRQIRRASTSIGANIAEGTGRISNADFVRFLHNSMGSIKEVAYFLDISKELNYLEQQHYEVLLQRINKLAKMLNSLISKINNTTNY